MNHEISTIVDQIRVKNRTGLQEWLAIRGVKIENGTTAFLAIVDSILARAKKRRVQEVISKLNTAKVMDVSVLIETLAQCQEELKELS